MRIKNVLMVLVGGLVVLATQANGQFAPTDAEIQNLPAFCVARLKGGPEAVIWRQTLGKDFIHVHHYCNGLNHINRYYRAKREQDKRHFLSVAEGNLRYMVTNAEPTFSLMPDVYLNLGVVYSLTNQTAQAITHFNKAIELNPRQPKAYNALSDYYAKVKQSAKALEIVTTGLRYNPDTKSLRRRYSELGGKLPYPEPIEPAPAAEVQSVKQEEPAEPASTSSIQVEPIAEPAIGSPTNPYCRFCPD